MSSDRVLVGIHDGHNAAVAAMFNGSVVWALQEERLSRVKNQTGFPAQSLQRLFRDLGIQPADVESYMFNGLLVPYGPATREENILAYKAVSSRGAKIKAILRQTPLYQWHIQRRKGQRLAAAAAAGLPAKKCQFLEHHLAHATTAYFGSGVRDGKLLVLTADGSGDGICATINVAERGVIRRLASVPESDSVGILWALITAYMGMVPLEHEYKLMGMAPYAPESGSEKVRKVFAAAFQEDSGNPLGWRRARGVPEINNSYEYFRERLEFCRFDWVCAGLQAFTEEFMVRWVSRCVAHTGVRKVALSGGLFMNVKLNKRIMELPEIEYLYVVPSCGDESNVFGLCYHAASLLGEGKPAALGSLYLGPDYGAGACAAAARRLAGQTGIKVTECRDIEAEVARLLAAGEVVARYKGKEEFGARALGNRSILADPSRHGVVQTINKMIKCRDFWMPFACSILDEDADTYMVNPKKVFAPYMILTFDSKRTEDVWAGSHPEDRTVRPQIVTEAFNPDYHRLIREFKRLTGRGAILNTSFNLHGFPIVSSPEDAGEVLLKSGLSHLALGTYLIQKEPAR